MPQEFHVLRCYECETFQVHIIKKSKKWDCKMCGAKQSLKKVYFCGTGKHCRLHVQSLNEQRIITDTLKTCHQFNDEQNENIENIQIDPQNSKWNEFLVQEENSEPEIDHSGMSFERPAKRRKYIKENNSKKTKNSVEKKSVWNNFITDDNSDEENHEHNQQNSEQSINYFQVENIEKSEEPECNNQENVKKSKWNCFLTEHEEKPITEENYENKITSKENLFNQSNENLDFLNIDV